MREKLDLLYFLPFRVCRKSLVVEIGNREQGTVSRVGWERFFLGIKLKSMVFEFPPRKSLHFFYLKTAQTLDP
jgi:hypothetical protein